MGGDYGVVKHPVGHSSPYVSQSPNETEAFSILMGGHAIGGGLWLLGGVVTINKWQSSLHKPGWWQLSNKRISLNKELHIFRV